MDNDRALRQELANRINRAENLGNYEEVQYLFRQYSDSMTAPDPREIYAKLMGEENKKEEPVKRKLADVRQEFRNLARVGFMRGLLGYNITLDSYPQVTVDKHEYRLYKGRADVSPRANRSGRVTDYARRVANEEGQKTKYLLIEKTDGSYSQPPVMKRVLKYDTVKEVVTVYPEGFSLAGSKVAKMVQNIFVNLCRSKLPQAKVKIGKEDTKDAIKIQSI